MPAADQQIRRTAHITHEPLAFAKGQFVNGAGDEDVGARERVRTVRDARVRCVVIAVVVVGMRKGVVGKELQTPREALLHLYLKRVVVAACVVAEVVAQVGVTAGESRKGTCIGKCGHTVEVKSSATVRCLCRRESGKSTRQDRVAKCVARTRDFVGASSDDNRISIVSGATTGENVRSFVPDVSYLDVHRRGYLALNCSIPGIESGQALNVGPNSRVNVVLWAFQREQAVGWDSRRSECWRTRRERKSGNAVVGRTRRRRVGEDVLIRENGKILGHDVAEV